jgi:hypothetical protein
MDPCGTPLVTFRGDDCVWILTVKVRFDKKCFIHLTNVVGILRFINVSINLLCETLSNALL